MKRVGGVAEQAVPTVAADDLNKVDGHHLEEKSAAPETALDKVLAMLRDLSDRMNRMEVSQREQAGGRRKDSAESSGLVRPWEPGREYEYPGFGAYPTSQKVAERHVTCYIFWSQATFPC